MTNDDNNQSEDIEDESDQQDEVTEHPKNKTKITSGGSSLSISDLEHLKREILVEITKVTSNHAQDREGLHNRLEVLEDWIKKATEAEDKKQESKGGSTTIVIPPEDIAPAQPTQSAVNESQDSKRKGWRSLW